MQRIDKILKSPVAPNTAQDLWLDTSNSDSPTLKVVENGEWKSVGGGSSPSPTPAEIETNNITELTKAQLDSLKVGDVVAKITGNQKHLYLVSYKGEGAGEGICLTYVAAGYSETISYDRTESGWAYNSTDIVPTPIDIPKPIVLSALPETTMTTQAELDAIGLTLEEITAAAHGLRTGVVIGDVFYTITDARLLDGGKYEFSFDWHYYYNQDISGALAYYVYFNGEAIEVQIGVEI